MPSAAGGCHCGQIRYEVNLPFFHQTNCYCTDCTKVSGAPVVTWFSVPVKDFQVVKGDLKVYKSSAAAKRSFCGNCGSHILFKYNELDEVDITAASLDDPNLVHPKDHVWVRSKFAFIKVGDSLPQYETIRTEGIEK